MRALAATLLATLFALAATLLATLFALPAPAAGAQAPPQWRLGIELQARVASSHFNGTVTQRFAGPQTRIGERVTLRLDRRTRCSSRSGARTVAIPCGSLGSRVAAHPGLQVIATGQFETGHFGAIAFAAVTLVLR